MKLKLTSVFVAIALMLVGVSTRAAEPGVEFQVDGTRILRAEEGIPRIDSNRFLDVAPVISEIYIEDANGAIVTDLVRGGQYTFWAYFLEPICQPYELAEGFFRANGKMVYHVSSVWDYNTDCNTIGAGFMLTVPMNAPLESYTWGARVTNAGGTDTFYPGSFNIVQ